MERLPSVQHIRNRIENIQDKDFKYGLMYLFLIAGDIGEAFGKFGPKGEDVKKVAYEFGDTKYEALIFNVHKSSRKDHGRFCVLPYDSYYEPWAESIYDYFQKNRSRALFGNENKKSRTKIRDKTDEIIRVFTDFPCYKKNKRVHFSTICLRDVRIANLRDFYRFRDVDLALFTFTKKYIESTDLDNIKLTISMDIDEKEFKSIGAEYFPLLLKPYSKLNDRDFYPHIDDAINRRTVERHQKALDICQKISSANYLTKNMLGDQLLNENFRFTTKLFEKCNNENDFTANISALAGLFDTDLSLVKQKYNFPPNWKTIKIVEEWLKINNITYSSYMIESWQKIIRLRNQFPLHANFDGKALNELYVHFGDKLSDPQDYDVLWNKITDKFLESLDALNIILNQL